MAHGATVEPGGEVLGHGLEGTAHRDRPSSLAQNVYGQTIDDREQLRIIATLIAGISDLTSTARPT